MTGTRSRAAVICLGGWGLQTMLHLWPRLRSIQEDRHFLGIERVLVDLNQLTAFTAILPDPIVPADANKQPDTYRPFSVLRPNPNSYPPPFAVEKLLNAIFQDLGDPMWLSNAQNLHLLHGERVAQQLWSRLSKPPNTYIEEVPFLLSGGAPFTRPPVNPDTRISRADMFKMGVVWSESLARTIIRHLIDPTRLDHVQPEDPFVQTSLYVLCSLAEPMASALIWPIVAELADTLGSSNVVKIVGVFSTGSFAPDATRIIEEAATYTALAELEALLGVPGRADSTEHLRNVVTAAAVSKSGWRERVGKTLFNRIYLLDREKSNQSLARDSLELTVLAGNAIEAFLSADGSLHIDRQLGPNSDASPKSPYSLLGAANNYVPLATYLREAIEEERKQVALETVLLETSEQELKRLNPHLSDLGVDPDAAISSLIYPGNRRIFSSVRSRRRDSARERLDRALGRVLFWRRSPTANQNMQEPTPSGDDELIEVRIAENYIISTSMANQLRNEEQPWRWRLMAEGQVNASLTRLELDLRISYFEEAWGLNYDRPTPPDDRLELQLAFYRERTWSERRKENSHTVPAALHAALRRVVTELCSSVMGLRRSIFLIEGWLDGVREVLLSRRIHETARQAEVWEEEDQDNYGIWQRNFARVAGGYPHPAATGVRAILGGLFAAYLMAGWLATSAPFTPGPDHYLMAGLAVTLIIAALGFLPWLIWRFRWWRTQRRRINLAVDRASNLANSLVRGTLERVYRRLEEGLKEIKNPLETTLAELTGWAQPQNPPMIPPLGVSPTHLRIPYTNVRIWNQVKARLRIERTPDGKTITKDFQDRWEQDGKDLRDWEKQGSRLAQQVRLALEQDLNAVELVGAAEVEARRRLLEASATNPVPAPTLELMREEVRKDREGSAWCPYASAVPNSAKRPTKKGLSLSTPQTEGPCSVHCTACPDLCNYDCPFSINGASQRSGWDLSAVIHQYLHKSVDHLLPKDRVLPGQPDFIYRLIKEHSIEHLLFGAQGLGTGIHNIQNGEVIAGTNEAYPAQERNDGRQNGHPVVEGGRPRETSPTATQFVEELQARAKPAANYEPAFSTMVTEVDFGVTEDEGRSFLLPSFKEKQTPLLSSQDPLSISALRTVNGLQLKELALQDRCKLEFLRLAATQKNELVLVPDPIAMIALYGDPAHVVPYAPIDY
ncbi:MAG TPA: hypothetical protein VJ183_05245 [Chloroflexia bacterium]|nr:hypothetical protein [Chloroflexia bacterium]